MIDNDFHTGSRIAKNCGSDAVYFPSIDECVSLVYTSMPTFLDAFLTERACAGGVVKSSSDLEGLRFCTHITGGLTITVDDVNADFSSLFDIAEITGL